MAVRFPSLTKEGLAQKIGEKRNQHLPIARRVLIACFHTTSVRRGFLGEAAKEGLAWFDQLR